MKNPPIKEKIKFVFHQFVNMSTKINPLYHYLFFKSSKIILRTKETLRIVPQMYHEKCEVFLETGIDKSQINEKPKRRKLKRIISTGKFIHSKNIDQVIEVFIQLNKLSNHQLELFIAGDGPLRNSIEKKYSDVPGVNILGKIPHEKIKFLLQDADLFLFCSIKEGGSHSLFESAMKNIPIACYDISGMREFPKNDSAIKIEPTYDIDHNITMLAEKIIYMFNHNKVENICKNAIKDLKDNYDWSELSKRYIRIYNEI